MNVAFCAAEVFPLAKTGGLGDVCGALPVALRRMGVNAHVFLPHYRCVDESGFEIKKINKFFSATQLADGTEVCLIEGEKYFNRSNLYGTTDGEYKDNLDRFRFFCHQILDYLRQQKSKVDIVHCHDWHTALIPVYLKEISFKEGWFPKPKTVLTVHNLAYQGIYVNDKFQKLGLQSSLFNPQVFEFYGKLNLLKAGLIYSDEVTTVSPQYARDILTKEFGCGLEGVLRERRNKVIGIINGVDYEIWDPKIDSFLYKRYTPHNWKTAKSFNKIHLQRKLRLKENCDVPLLGFIGRLFHQKGIGLILEALKEMLTYDLQLVIQGVGDKDYVKQLKQVALENKNQLVICDKFDEQLAHQIYAGADLFLMPSAFEPCGLSQMISLKYGTVPIVFKTGGLIDTIVAFNSGTLSGNGFVFQEYSVTAFLEAVRKAIKVYQNKDLFDRLVDNGFHSDFSWDRSAIKYVEIYKKIVDERKCYI